GTPRGRGPAGARRPPRVSRAAPGRPGKGGNFRAAIGRAGPAGRRRTRRTAPSRHARPATPRPAGPSADRTDNRFRFAQLLFSWHIADAAAPAGTRGGADASTDGSPPEEGNAAGAAPRGPRRPPSAA